MTPLQFADQLRDDLTTIAVPQPVYAQLGDIVVDCAATTVSVMSVTEQEVTGGLGGQCDVVEIGEVLVIAARECADVANDDGTTDHVAMDAVSAAMDADGALLLEWADKQMSESWFRLGRPALSYTITGAIAFVTLAVSLPIP